MSHLSFSSRYSAKAMLMGLSMLKILSRFYTLAETANKLINSFVEDDAHLLKLPGFVEPSLETLAIHMSSALSFSISGSSQATRAVQSDVASAARTLISRSLAHRTSTDVNTIIADYQRLLVVSGHTLSPMERGLLISVLGLILSECGSRIDDSVARFISECLIEYISTDTEKRPFFPVAVDSFVHSLPHWKRLVVNPNAPLHALFDAAISKTSQTIDVQCAQNGFLEIGYADPDLLTSVLMEEISKRKNQIGALTALGGLLARWNAVLYDHLPLLTQITVTALDPSSPALRDKCIKAAASVIHHMISNYPMVAFHQDSQRLAVGTKNAIHIFDTKTGQSVSCRVSGWISAVAFSPSGKSIATYSSDNKLCVWQVNGTISALKMRYKNKTPDWTVTPDHPECAPESPINNIKVFWEAPGQLCLFRPSAPSTFQTQLSKNF